MIDLAGHAAYAVIVAGTWLGAKGYAGGWGLRMIGDIGWLALGILMGMSSIIFWSGVFFLVDLVAFVRTWRGNQ